MRLSTSTCSISSHTPTAVWQSSLSDREKEPISGLTDRLSQYVVFPGVLTKVSLSKGRVISGERLSYPLATALAPVHVLARDPDSDPDPARDLPYRIRDREPRAAVKTTRWFLLCDNWLST